MVNNNILKHFVGLNLFTTYNNTIPPPHVFLRYSHVFTPFVMRLYIPITTITELDFGISKITHSIFLSGIDYTAENLYDNGITHILNVSTKEDKIYSGINNMFINIPDGGDESIENLSIEKYFPSSYAFIQNAINADGKMLVHCHMCISRSATIVIVYLMKTLNMPYIEVLAIVNAKHPSLTHVWHSHGT